ncbi:aromatic compound dioxygenase [Cylindrobasidium torrendii FP15055 ss-10]|uniref:Aromatic compound dioxygenase n=1 Tax=Cylindrobasidium torrendii FP15055 ss-10 TaxID=1314674 RepID=A0A0D7BVQ8_9AGAR|nr:aromatic compound dioxygenase [Cylindrobasidium torrendii FP15055 ss-10]
MVLTAPFAAVFGLLMIATTASAHPHKATGHAKAALSARSGNTCGDAIARRAEGIASARRRHLHSRMLEDDSPLARRGLESRAKYPEIQNTSCVLAPDTVVGPYFVDGELYRRDVTEGEPGVPLYLDIGVLDMDTCEPLENAFIDMWHCNASGTYSGYTGINPDTVEAYDGECVTVRADGTTDDTTFLRGFTKTDASGIAEFLSIFPGYYSSRTTHIHITVHVNGTISEDGTNTLASSSIQHVGQLFFEEDLINQVYELDNYNAHLSTLDRVLNDEDSVYVDGNTGGYSAVITTELLGDTLADGLIGYITVTVNTTNIVDMSNTNPVGVIPTVSLAEGAEASASAVDACEGL